LFVLTLVVPGSRAWPPPGRDFSRQYRYAWTLTAASFAGIVALGLSIGAAVLP
jgi:hypothetical protein